jgi:hypothetical protein
MLHFLLIVGLVFLALAMTGLTVWAYDRMWSGLCRGNLLDYLIFHNAGGAFAEMLGAVVAALFNAWTGGNDS